MKRVLVLSCLMPVLLAVSCDDDDDGPVGPEIPAAAYADYVWFDTVSYLVALMPGWREPWVDGDFIVGEPFEDVNGNGEYDEGIDIFIRSSDSTLNMDFNHNGQRDGPDDPYTVGTPFDDVNGDGDYDAMNFAYDLGEPFGDLDGNGLFSVDGIRVVRCEFRQDTAVEVDFSMRDSVCRYVSDSGFVYAWPSYDAVRMPGEDVYRSILPDHQFFIHEWGLQFRAFTLFVPLLDTGAILAGVSVDTGFNTNGGTETAFTRRVDFGQELVIAGDTLSSVMVVHLGNFTVEGLPYPDAYQDWSFDFYFAEELGFVGFREHSLSLPPGGERRAYFNIRYDTVPRPMAP